MIAPPIPCTALDNCSISVVCAAPQSNEATVNTPTPIK